MWVGAGHSCRHRPLPLVCCWSRAGGYGADMVMVTWQALDFMGKGHMLAGAPHARPHSSRANAACMLLALAATYGVHI
jgi:hypothetical protein